LSKSKLSKLKYPLLFFFTDTIGRGGNNVQKI